MEPGDQVLVELDIHKDFARHGLVIKAQGAHVGCEILFADGIIENYYPHECRILTDKEWFTLQLGAKLA